MFDPTNPTSFTRPSFKNKTVILQCRDYIYKDVDIECQIYKNFKIAWIEKRLSLGGLVQHVSSIDRQFSECLPLTQDYELCSTGMILKFKEAVYQLDVMDRSILKLDKFMTILFTNVQEYISFASTIREFLIEDGCVIKLYKEVLLSSNNFEPSDIYKIVQNLQDEPSAILNEHDGLFTFNCCCDSIKDQTQKDYESYAITALVRRLRSIPIHIALDRLLQIVDK